MFGTGDGNVHKKCPVFDESTSNGEKNFKSKCILTVICFIDYLGSFTGLSSRL